MSSSGTYYHFEGIKIDLWILFFVGVTARVAHMSYTEFSNESANESWHVQMVGLVDWVVERLPRNRLVERSIS